MLCDKSIVKPLSYLATVNLRRLFLKNLWKKANVVPIHKKGEKYLIKNHCPVSLLPIFGNFLKD